MLIQTIEQIGREKNIEPEVIIEAIEEAMAVAAQKYYRTDDHLVAEFNEDSGEVDVYTSKTVVEEVEDPTLEMGLEEAREKAAELGQEEPEIGDEIRWPMPTEPLGRIAAQAAKQVIYQKVRDAERENIYAEYIDRVGEIVTGIVKRFERGDMMVDLGQTEAILPRREQSRAEHYNIGDRVRVVIVDVLRETRGPQVVVSRSSPELLKRLFEMEVPEIYDGTVEIKTAVREGGDRAKVAVHSTEPDVDPVGACVGMRGSRVQSIIRELRGEKIDIVEWAPEEHQFAINALKPARVNRVGEITVENEEGEEEEHLEVIVDEDQLSLAIGKRGQNVRLAGKLLGRKIDVKSAEQKREELEGPAVEAEPEVPEDAGEAAATDAVEAEQAPPGVDIEELPGVGPKVAEALREAGYETAESIAAAGEGALLAVPGIGAKTAMKITRAAAELAEAAREAAPEPGPAPTSVDPVEESEPPRSEGEAVARAEREQLAAEPAVPAGPDPEVAATEPGDVERPEARPDEEDAADLGEEEGHAPGEDEEEQERTGVVESEPETA